MSEQKMGAFVEGDGYRVDWTIPAEHKYRVTVTAPDGRVESEEYPWTWTPTFGPDVADQAQADEIADRLLAKMRAAK